jgi:hypothetical protein
VGTKDSPTNKKHHENVKRKEKKKVQILRYRKQANTKRKRKIAAMVD